MNRTSKTAIALLTAACAAPALASTIIIQTGYANVPPQASAQAYRSIVDEAVAISSPGYGAAPVSEFDNVENHLLFPGDQLANIAWRSTVQFDVNNANARPWQFRAGVDFGNGGAILIDGAALDWRPTDGGQQAQFSIAGSPFRTFGDLDGLPPIPEPGGVAMLVAGLGMLACRRRAHASR